MYRIRFAGPSAIAVRVATALAEADGVELIASEPPSILGANMVELAVAVEGTFDAVGGAVASIRDGMPKGASIEIAED